jgi:two-component system, LytTR family, sensor kinase
MINFNFKNIFSHKSYFKFMIIGVVSIFIFLFSANIFVSQTEYFDTFFTISIIIVLWLGCSAIVYLIDKKYNWNESAIKRLLIELSAILVFSTTIYIIFEYVPKKIHGEEIIWTEIKLNATITSIISVLIVAISESLDLLNAWKSSILKNKELEKENIEAQFYTLKSQVNPHFLFNSLNTLANYVQDNELASEYLQNLSEYLRYILVLNEDKLTRIEKEFEILAKYIFLQKSRFKEGLDIHMEISQKVLNNDAYVPPFSLQILLENAIKHNVISKSKPLFIKIFTSDDERISIINNVQEKEVQNSTHIGLKNIIDRYRLITNKEVIIENNGKEFKVSLPIIYEPEFK